MNSKTLMNSKSEELKIKYQLKLDLTRKMLSLKNRN